MSSVRIIAGGVAPECVKFTITAGSSGVDLRDATAATITLTPRSGGIELSWDGIIEAGATEDQLVVRHDLAAGETGITGRYAVIVTLTIPGSGSIRAQCQDANIVKP